VGAAGSLYMMVAMMIAWIVTLWTLDRMSSTTVDNARQKLPSNYFSVCTVLVIGCVVFVDVLVRHLSLRKQQQQQQQQHFIRTTLSFAPIHSSF
jgi:hypothetical protein